jgi:flagellar biosynthesis protein FlhF
MKIKVFTAKTVAEAMQRVHRELSRDALVLETRQLADGVEVTAAVDYEIALNQSSQRRTTEPAPPKPLCNSLLLPQTANDPLLPAAALRAQQMEIDQLRREMSELRQTVQEQLASLLWSSSPGVAPHVGKVFRLLSSLGLEESLIREWIADLPSGMSGERLEQVALEMLVAALPVVPEQALAVEGTEPQVIALVGPTGVGKTTTLVKLAAQHVRHHGADAVAVISTDHYRIGARQQLAEYGARLGVDFVHVEDSQQLQRQLLAWSEKSLILIDTAGMSPRDQLLANQLALLGPVASRLRTYLVMVAGGQYESYGEVIRQFRAVPLAGVILTKLDEAGRLGPAMSALIRHHIGLAWVSNGQKVPDDLHYLAATDLLDRALALSMQYVSDGLDSSESSPFGASPHAHV